MVVPRARGWCGGSVAVFWHFELMDGRDGHLAITQTPSDHSLLAIHHLHLADLVPLFLHSQPVPGSGPRRVVRRGLEGSEMVVVVGGGRRRHTNMHCTYTHALRIGETQRRRYEFTSHLKERKRKKTVDTNYPPMLLFRSSRNLPPHKRPSSSLSLYLVRPTILSIQLERHPLVFPNEGKNSNGMDKFSSRAVTAMITDQLSLRGSSVKK